MNTDIILDLETKRTQAFEKSKRVFRQTFLFIYVTFVLTVLSAILAVRWFGDPEKLDRGDGVPIIIGVLLGGLFFALVVGGLITLLRKGTIADRFWSEVKIGLVEAIGREMNLTFQYTAKGISEAEFRRASLFGHGMLTSSDMVTANYNGRQIIFSDCHVSSRANKKDSTATFYALFFTFPFDMNGSEGPVKFIPFTIVTKAVAYLKPNNHVLISNRHLKKIPNPDPELGKTHEIYAPETHAAVSVIREELLRSISSLVDLFNKQTPNVYVSLNQGHFHMAVIRTKDLFQGTFSLKKTLLEMDVAAVFRNDLALLNDVISRVAPLMRK